MTPTPPDAADEEMVPHAFVSRTPYEPGDDRDIWCKECEYHREHVIHQPPAADAAPLRTLREWHPMETAPKDGTVVLAWREGWVKPTLLLWLSHRDLEEPGWCPYERQPIRPRGSSPTHWMPFPDPPKETPLSMDTLRKMFYFGCWNSAGHYLHEPGGHTRSREVVGPFAVYGGDQGLPLDGKFAPGPHPQYGTGGMQDESFVALTYVRGWTVMAMWDRSVDTRPGSNAAFLVEGAKTLNEMWAQAKDQFPHIVARLKAAPKEIP